MKGLTIETIERFVKTYSIHESVVRDDGCSHSAVSKFGANIEEIGLKKKKKITGEHEIEILIRDNESKNKCLETGNQCL